MTSVSWSFQSDALESESRNGRKRVSVVPVQFRYDDNDENDHSQRKKSKHDVDGVSRKRLMTGVRGAKEKENVDKLPAPPTPLFHCTSSPITSRLPLQALPVTKVGFFQRLFIVFW